MSDNFLSQIKEELNPSQYEAVTFGNGPLLLIAGAGSGKTKTLTYRVAKLIRDGVPADRILLLTFTRKASEEMMRRASALCGGLSSNVSGGTFHAFANIALRHYGHLLGYDSQFTILDRADAEDLVQRIRKEKANSDKRFPKKRTILSLISKSINTCTPIEKCILSDCPQFMNYSDEIEAIARDYIIQKQHMNAMDYDDLLTRFCDLVTQFEEVREQFKNHYHSILVDEYQDTNIIQARLITAITNDAHNIMVVGDDSQSIYSFRGAHFENIMKFPDLFPNTHVIRLEQNYRSTQGILDLTNAVIAQAKQKYTKKLFTDKISDEKPQLIETANDNEQSQWVCKKILEHHENGIALKDMAVLIRSGFHSNDLEIQLKQSNIPFIKMGGFKFMEASHIKDICAYLRIIYNPKDSISWSRILLLLEGCGPGATAKILDGFRQNPNNLHAVLATHQNKKYGNELRQLLDFSSNPAIRAAKPQDIIKEILLLYTPVFKLKYDDFTKRQSDIDSFTNITDRFENLETLLTEMSLDPPSSSEPEATKEEDMLCLSTIHSSKGLEWKVVFLLSAIDGFLPSFQSMGDETQLEEERRLMYVALTRAEDHLYIMKPNIDSPQFQASQFASQGSAFSTISRFLQEDEICDRFCEKVSLGPAPAQSNFSIPIDDDLSSIFAPRSTSKSSPKRRRYYL